MASFQTDSIALSYSDLSAAERWWREMFECKEAKMPPHDDPLPSDVALKLPGNVDPCIFLSDRAEELIAKLQRTNGRQIVFTNKLSKAHEQMERRGGLPGPIQDERGTQFFEVRDPEGNVIEICLEP